MSNTTLRRKKRQRKSTRSSKTSNSNPTGYSLQIKSVKRGKSIKFEVWQTNNIGQKGKVSTFDFRKDAKKLADFHNENQPWKVNGGLPKFLLD